MVSMDRVLELSGFADANAGRCESWNVVHWGGGGDVQL